MVKKWEELVEIGGEMVGNGGDLSLWVHGEGGKKWFGWVEIGNAEGL